MASAPIVIARTPTVTTVLGGLRRYVPGTDVGLALGVVCLLAVLVLPLPTLLLDLGLSLSITASVLVLMVALFLQRPLDFTSFPHLAAADHIVAAVAERGDDQADPLAWQ